MGSINIEGLGIVEIEGDDPSEAEQTVIINALNEISDTQEMPAETIEPEALQDIEEQEMLQEMEERKPREGPLGIIPAEARGVVRGKIEEQPGLIQLLAEISPATGGAVGGAILGAPFFPPFGAIGGAIVGGVAGEVLAQETGIAPESELNILLSGAGPVAGPAVGGAFRLGRRAVGAGITGFPFARAARARNAMSKAVEEFESLGTRIIEKQKGLIAKPSGELYDSVRRAGVIIPPKALSGTQKAIQEISEEMSVVSAFPEVRQAMKALQQISQTLQAPDVSMDTLVRTRQLIGNVVRRTEAAGGIKLGSAKKAFAAISNDLDKIAKDPSLVGRAARLAKAATQRAKLEFSVKDLEAGAARFITTKEAKGGVNINIEGFAKWFKNATNPKSKQFNKNFTDALKDEIPAINKRLKDLSKILVTGGPGGPGSLVVRGRTAAVGAIVGGILGGPIGAGLGAVAGAGAPERMVSILTSKTGAAFLERAARLGKGQINMKTWIAAGQIATRGLGEGKEITPEEIPTPEAL